jgi:hypothetical protein
MEYIIINMDTKRAIYGLERKTVRFSTELAAEEFAKQICENYLVVGITY